MLGEMTREEVREIAGECVVVLPVAAIEQHGPHLPIETDATLTFHVAKESAERATRQGASVCVAPLLPYGISEHHRPFAGVLSLKLSTMVHLLRDIGESLVHSGFRKIFILNGHGGNSDAIGAVAAELATTHDVSVAAASYWTLAKGALMEDEVTGGFPWIPGHAGSFETACMRALRGELVCENDLPPESVAGTPRAGLLGPVALHRHRWMERIGGYTDRPADGTAEMGRRALEIIAREVAAVLREFAMEAGS